MNDIIDFFFQIWGVMFSTIVANWLLSTSLLIAILGLVINLVNQSEEK